MQDDSDEYDEDEERKKDEVVIVDADANDEIDVVEEGMFCVVEYRLDGTEKKVYYVSKIIGVVTDGPTVSVSVSSLRKHGDKFQVPENPDVNLVDKCQIKRILPNPQSFGGTSRLKSVYIFSNVYFAKDMDLR